MSFTYDSPVFFDEFDPNGHLHNARFAVHVERAQTTLFEQLTDPVPAGDLHYVVRVLHMEFLSPVATPGPMTVSLTGLTIGKTSATYGFRCGSDPVHAEGHRVIVKIAPDTGRPVPWSDRYRQVFEELGS